MITEVLIPVRRFDNDHETRTFLEVENFGDGQVGFHVNPGEDKVVTAMFSIEDGWRFMREMARALVEAENS